MISCHVQYFGKLWNNFCVFWCLPFINSQPSVPLWKCHVHTLMNASGRFKSRFTLLYQLHFEVGAPSFSSACCFYQWWVLILKFQCMKGENTAKFLFWWFALGSGVGSPCTTFTFSPWSHRDNGLWTGGFHRCPWFLLQQTQSLGITLT